MLHLFYLITITCLSQTLGYITFASGDEYRFEYYYNNQNFYCANQATPYKTYTVTFGGTFERIPKLIFWTYFQNYGIEDNTLPCEVYFTKTVTITGFTTSITCPSQGRFFGFKFQWVAIDDDRLQVFEETNKIMTGQTTQVYTLTHSNPNFNKAFASIFSLGINGPIDIKYTINSVTTNQVAVQFTTTTDKLIRIGYHIVVGVSQAFTMDDIFIIPAYTNNQTATSGTKTSPYYTDFIPVPSDTIFLFPYAGIIFPCDFNLRQNRTTEILNSTGVKYMYESWGNSYVDIPIRKVWLKKSIDQVFLPFLCKKMQITRVQNPNQQNLPQMVVIISELNFQYPSAASQELLLDQQQTLNLLVSFQCDIGYLIKGSILKCVNCVKTSWIINQNCYTGGNYVTFKIKLNQQDQVYQKIKIDVTSSNFTITQYIINQKPETYIVANLEAIRK